MKRILFVLFSTVVFFASAQDTIMFNYTGSLDTLVIPSCVNRIHIDVAGAEGGMGSSSIFAPGKGAIMSADFEVLPNDSFRILVGQKPLTGNGGGGGSFVATIANVPFIVAGGGGGSSESVDDVNKEGQITQEGGTGAAGGGVGGVNGFGGSIGASFASGAGGGFYTDGQDGWTSNTGGKAFVNGGSIPTGSSAYGGFGGGGCGSAYVVGGGGGGYSGGGAGSNSIGGGGVGGGGGSINTGFNQQNMSGFNTGDGFVRVVFYTNPFKNASIIAADSACPGDTMHVYFEGAWAHDSLLWSAFSAQILQVVNDTEAIVLAHAGIDTIYVHAKYGLCYDTLFKWSVSVDSILTNISVINATSGNNGQIDAIASGGVAPYSYNLDYGSSQPNGLFANLAPGTYLLGVSDARGCIQYQSVEVLDATGISNAYDSNFKVFPNPATNVLFIDCGIIQSIITVEISDYSGRVILSKEFNESSQIKLDVSSLSSGFYQVTISTEQEQFQKNFVVE